MATSGKSGLIGLGFETFGGAAANRWPEFAIALMAIGGLILLYCAWNFWNDRREKLGKARIELPPSQLLIFALVGTWLFLTISLGLAAWVVSNREDSRSSLADTPKSDEGPLTWFVNLTMEGGPLSGRNVFALKFQGANVSQKEVKIKGANIISALKGTELSLEVEAENEIVSIEQIELIPPGAPIVLIAKFGPPDPNMPGKIMGLEPKVFLDTWRQFSLNVEDDTRKYRRTFNEGNLAPFFPGMVGPHISKKVLQ